MQSETIALEETHCFSQAFIDYISGKESLKHFYSSPPTLDNFQSVIEKRTFSKDKRLLLQTVLQSQYEHLNPEKEVIENLNSLSSPNTYTVTTGHQLNIFTGPLYFIYKIVTTIATCKALQKSYPDFHFIPVYWMASEDHDFEEISYFHYEGKKITWDTAQKGAVGRFDPSQLKAIASQLPEGAFFFKKAYEEKTLANAVRSYVNHLFQEEGLLVIDADDARLKRSFIPVMEKDIFEHAPEMLVAQTSSRLEAEGIKPQVHAREINFFYLHGDLRARIERTEKQFKVVDSGITFTEEDLKQLIHTHPERFSPNVILRPLYQETILPNLAYVGGPSELMYWLQLKSVFDHFEEAFPILMPRNFAMVSTQRNKEKWEKLKLTTSALFSEADAVFSKWVKQNSKNELSLSDELKEVKRIAEQMKQTAKNVDSTLCQHIEAITESYRRKVEKAEKKLLRAEKRKHIEVKTQISKITDEAFPGGTLQERKANFLSFYVENPNFIKNLIEVLDPFKHEMYLFYL